MKFRPHTLVSVSGALLGFFLLAIPVLAAEGAEPNPADSSAGLIFRWLNFAIVFGGIAYLLGKHGGAFFGAQAKAIAASIHEGTAAKEEAERQLREVDAKIARLDRDVVELREAARRDSEAEAERLNASGLAEIEKIDQAARAELAAAERAARQELRAMAASMAVERASALIGSRMNQGVRAKFLSTFLVELGRSAN
jgi:F0F1-type ATP synthase membrane subunit b/b'